METTNTNVPGHTTINTGGNHFQANEVQLHYHGTEANDIDKLLNNVAPSALYNTAQIEDPAKCHPGTREAILRRLFGALDRRSTDPAKPFTWLHGAAGAGKSAIARTLCEQLHLDNQLLASFFFFRASPERNTAARLISTLTFQFRAIIPQLRPHIKQYIRANPLIFTQSLDTQAHALLINPIRQLHEEGKLPQLPQTAIVIDGLDECEGSENRRNVLHILHTLQSELPFPVTILVASRPNRDIEAVFKDSPFEGHTIEEPLNDERDVDADIRKFYTESFAKIEKFHVRSPYFTRVDGKWPAPAVIKLLVEKTSGQFIFAKTVIRFVEPDRSDPDERLQMVLGALPTLHHRPFEQLDAVYKLALSVIEPDELETTLTIIGLFLCDYCSSSYFPPVFMGNTFSSIFPPKLVSKLVEWILDLKDGQCQQFLVGLEALLTLTSDGGMQIFHKSFSDFLFDSSRSGQFYIAQDLLHERILRSFIKHNFYHPSMYPRFLMFTNMEFLFSNARITPELLSAIESVDFVALDVLVRGLPPPVDCGEDSWLRICDLFLRCLLNSPIPDKARLAVPLATSLRIVATSRLAPYLENPTLWPLLYLATRNDRPRDPNFLRGFLQLIHRTPPHLLKPEQTDGYHFTTSTFGSRRKKTMYVLYKTEGPLLEAARAALPEHQSPDSYLVTLLLKLVDQCIQGAIEPSFLVASGYLWRLLPETDAHDVLWSKLGEFLAAFREELDSETICAIEKYTEQCKHREQRRRNRILAERALWDPNDPDPHHLTDDWERLEEIIKAEPVLSDTDPIPNSTDSCDPCEDVTKAKPSPPDTDPILHPTDDGNPRQDHIIEPEPVLSDTPKSPLSPTVRRVDSIPPSLLYTIPVVLIVGLALYRKGFFRE